MSQHLVDYPQVDEALVDEALEARIAVVLKVKNLGLALRNTAKVGVRQPLSTLMVKPADAAEQAVLEDPRYAAQVLGECNLKKLDIIEDTVDMQQQDPHSGIVFARLLFLHRLKGNRVEALPLLALSGTLACGQGTRRTNTSSGPMERTWSYAGMSCLSSFSTPTLALHQ